MKAIKTVARQNEFFRAVKLNEGDTSPAMEQNIINVFDEIEYQQVIGFGGAFTESSAYNYSKLNDKQKKEFLYRYFNKEKGINYNFGRCHINSCDFSLDIYSYVKDGDTTLETFNIERDKKYIIPFIKDAMQVCGEELILFASPWSPPAYMKENENVVGGGKLKEEYKKVWAKYYAKFIKAYALEGIKISAITVQNEPIAKQTWESCYYTPQDEQQFIEKYLIDAMEEENLSDVKIMIWDHNKERVYDRSKKIFASKKVEEKVWGVGFHWYSGDHFDGLRLVHEKYNKPLISTEICGSINSDALFLAERYCRELCGDFNNFTNAFCDWNLLLSDKGGPFHNRSGSTTSSAGVVFEDKSAGCYAPVIYNTQSGELEYTPIYYYIGHFSKFVHRGAKRIATTKYSEDIQVCGFKNPDGGTAVVIANVSDRDQEPVIRHKDICTSLSMEPHSIATVII